MFLVNGEFLPWSQWTECSVTCNEGQQTRNRTCFGVAHGGIDCIGPTFENRTCFPVECPGNHLLSHHKFVAKYRLGVC